MILQNKKKKNRIGRKEGCLGLVGSLVGCLVGGCLVGCLFCWLVVDWLVGGYLVAWLVGCLVS